MASGAFVLEATHGQFVWFRKELGFCRRPTRKAAESLGWCQLQSRPAPRGRRLPLPQRWPRTHGPCVSAVDTGAAGGSSASRSICWRSVWPPAEAWGGAPAQAGSQGFGLSPQGRRPCWEAACWAPSWMTQYPGVVQAGGQRVPIGSSPDPGAPAGALAQGRAPRLQFVAVGLWSQGPGCLRAQRAC